MLVLSREAGQEVLIGGERPLVRIQVAALRCLGGVRPNAQLAFEAPPSVMIHRAELVERDGWVMREDAGDDLAEVRTYAGRPDLIVLAFKNAAAAERAKAAGVAWFKQGAVPRAVLEGEQIP